MKLSMAGRNVGFVEGEYSSLLQPILIQAYVKGWQGLAEKVPSSETANVYFIGAPINGFYKEFLPRNNLDKLKAVVGKSRCKKHIAQSSWLSQLGINTPKLLAHGKLDSNEFIVTASVEGISFGEFLSSLFRRPKTKQALRMKRALIVSLGALVGRLHRVGVTHGDLRPNNILLAWEGELIRWYLIDNERNKTGSTLARKDVVKNLVQINMFHSIDWTMSDRRRFFNAYFNTYTPTWDARTLEKDVLAVAKARLHRKPVYQPDTKKVMEKISRFPSFSLITGMLL